MKPENFKGHPVILTGTCATNHMKCAHDGADRASFHSNDKGL